MNENEFSKKIAAHLNRGADQLAPVELARLRASREQALAAMGRQPAAGLALAMGGGRTLRLPRISRKMLFLLAIISIAGIWTAYSQLSQDDYYDNVGELDAQLLTGELPINAFLDKDFESWVKESSE